MKAQIAPVTADSLARSPNKGRLRHRSPAGGTVLTDADLAFVEVAEPVEISLATTRYPPERGEHCYPAHREPRVRVDTGGAQEWIG
jgi:hypothetical protein